MSPDNLASTSDASDLAAIDTALARFIDHQRDRLAPLGPDLARFIDAAADFVSGGKRMRPLFCLAGWRSATGVEPHTPPPAAVVAAAAAWEWLQGSALVHDDLMDASDTRRGRPSVHRAFAQRHVAEGAVGDAEGFGTSAAVLMGDLMLSWCDEMLRTAGTIDDTFTGRRYRLDVAFTVLDQCKTEVVAGQFLDVMSQTRPTVTPDEAMVVVRFKSAKYTIERPLHLGAVLGGGDRELLDRLSDVALPLGEAFQLRDDVLGVFGDPAVTGKPAGDDLREGKRTLLVARAAELGGAGAQKLLSTSLGTREGVAQVRDLIVECGALASVESDISALAEQARRALEPLPEAARAALEPLVARSVRREH